MMRYLKLWCSFLKMSAMADLEYRTNIVARVIGEFGWYTLQLSVFEVLYTHTTSISGWDVHSMRVFMGTLFLTDVVYMILFAENMDNIAAMVKKGDLDLYLTKPVNSQFMLSLRKVSISYFINLICILVYLFWAIHRLSTPVTVPQVGGYLLLAVCGVVIVYSCRFLFATLSVVLQDAGNMQFVWHQIYRLSTRPDPIYPKILRALVFTLIPVAFASSVPARILIEGVDLRLLAAAPCVAAGFLWLSHRLWNRALRHYSSASS